MPEIDHRTKQVIFTRQDNGDFEIQVQREKCVRVDSEAFVKPDSVLTLAVSGHLADSVTLSGGRVVTLQKLMQVFAAFGELWDAGGRTATIILNTPAESQYSVMCIRQRQNEQGEWVNSSVPSFTLAELAEQVVQVSGEAWEVFGVGEAVRLFCDLWAGD